MIEGTGKSLYILVAIVIFGLFVNIATLFGTKLHAQTSNIAACVQGYITDEPTDCGSGGEEKEEEEPDYVLATDKDFVGTANGEFIYTGDAEYVKLPHSIKGVPVTSYENMFKGTSVSKVISDNPNVTSMEGMFEESKAKEIDISGIDTSNVTNMRQLFYKGEVTKIKGLETLNTSKVRYMSYMFSRSQVKELDVSNFDTSNVTNMSGMFYRTKTKKLDVSNFNTSKVRDMYRMFYGSHATELDLSNFDTSNVTDTSDMFMYSEANKVYAGTQADADKFNASSNKPDGLQVIVKQ